MCRTDNSVIRMNPGGDTTGIFNEIRQGTISSIDASNPLRILLHYPAYNQLIVLNNRMGRKSTLSLGKVTSGNQVSICSSADGNIWILDVASGDLLKTDESLNELQRYNLRISGLALQWPVQMQESERHLFIAEKNGDIHKLDLFAFPENTYHLNGTDLQVQNDIIILRKGSEILATDIRTQQSSELSIPESGDIMNIRVVGQKIYVLYHNKLSLFQLIQSNNKAPQR